MVKSHIIPSWSPAPQPKVRHGLNYLSLCGSLLPGTFHDKVHIFKIRPIVSATTHSHSFVLWPFAHRLSPLYHLQKESAECAGVDSSIIAQGGLRDDRWQACSSVEASPEEYKVEPLSWAVNYSNLHLGNGVALEQVCPPE